MNNKLFKLIKKYKKPGDFLYSKVDDEVISRIERALEVKLPKQYADYIRMFGNGGICGIEIFGVGQTGRLIVVDTNLVLREDEFPKNLVAIAGYEKYMDCLDCDTGHVLSWDFENFEDKFECFDDYILDCIYRAIIEDFLKCEFVKYDFTNDCDYTKDGKYKELDGYEKYFAYKTLKNVKDPDSSSDLLQSIYKKLWPELVSQDYMKKDDWIRSDTMTSVQHTLARYFADEFPDEVKQFMKDNPRQRHISVKMCAAMYSQSQYKKVAENLNNNRALKHFISVYHTLGNFSPVPTGFNTARSGVGYLSNFDYWDLTLMKIKKYFDLKKEKKSQAEITNDVYPISELLHYEETVMNCLKWLDGYSSWKEFVEKNFFQDYVDEKGEVVPFCNGHSWKNGCNEISNSNYNEFFENASKRIEDRTNRMVEALKKKIE